jgi:hypothetical protein
MNLNIKKLLFALLICNFSLKIALAQWQPEVQFTSDHHSSTSPNSTSIAASSDTVYVVWFYSYFQLASIYYVRSIDAGISWGTSIQLNSNSHPLYPSIAISGQFLHIVCEYFPDFAPEIMYKRSSDGGMTWGNDFRLTNDLADSEYPAVAVSGSFVHVVW